MADTPTKNAGEHLQNSHQDLQFIMSKVKKLAEINRLVSQLLDPEIAKYCQVANLAGNRITLLTANGSIATELRFQSQNLLRKFRQDPLLKHIQHIDCKVSPSPTQPQLREQTAGRQVQRLSPQTADFLKQIAEELNDPKLKASVLKLAGYTEKGK